jgi:hypothetical protein
MLISFLMGHSLQGVSAKYTNELMIANSEALRAAQEKISRRIFKLLELTLVDCHEAPLVLDKSSGLKPPCQNAWLEQTRASKAARPDGHSTRV